MKEFDMAINTSKIVSIVVSFQNLKQRITRIFSKFFGQKAKIHLWNKLKLYMKAPILMQFSPP